MTGDELRAIREGRGEDQQAFAAWLNGGLSRKYDRSRVSRWESGAERIPQQVEAFLLQNKAPRSVQPRRRAVLAVANQKGGVGKTTTAVNLAYALGKSGVKVLLIDGDPQANATVHLGYDPGEVETGRKGLYSALLGGAALTSIVLPACGGLLDLVPSSIGLAAAETELVAEPASSFVLREKLAETRSRYDIILIDCPPNLGLLTINALAASDLVLIPVQTEVFAGLGVPLLLETISKLRRRANPKLTVFGILPTMYSARLTQDQASLKEIQEQYQGKMRVFPTVPRATLFAQSSGAGRPAMDVDPGSACIQAYADLAHALVAYLENGEAAGAAA